VVKLRNDVILMRSTRTIKDADSSESSTKEATECRQKVIPTGKEREIIKVPDPEQSCKRSRSNALTIEGPVDQARPCVQ